MIRLFHRRFAIFSICTLIAAFVIAFCIKYQLRLTLSQEVDLAYFTILPLFVLTILQLVRTHRTQQAKNIKDILNEFRREPGLYSSYFDLVYRFDNRSFEAVKQIAQPVVASLKEKHPEKSWHEIVELERPSLESLDSLQDGRTHGERLYWPALFHYSEEEFRLDGLLDYFNAVGFYHWEGLVSMRDISSMLGDYLAVVVDRKIVKEYMRFCVDEWVYDTSVGAADPYPYLQILLDEFSIYNKRRAKSRETVRLRQRINDIKNS